MKILIRNNDQVVIYAQDDIELDTEAHGNNWRDPNFNSNNATVVEATPPAFWCGGEWMYDNGEWVVIDSQKYAQRVEQARLATVPSQVTMRQARLALLGVGKLSQVTAAINALPSPQKEAAAIEWEYSQTVERHRGFVLLLGAAIGLSALDLDNLFIAASAL